MTREETKEIPSTYGNHMLQAEADLHKGKVNPQFLEDQEFVEKG